VPRSRRWESQGSEIYRSVEGLLVRRYRGEWWAEVAYALLPGVAPGEVADWEDHADRLGPFRRPRNAMVEAERHAAALRGRHRDRARLGWGEDPTEGLLS